MSIEVREPTKGFYSALDDVIKYQIKSLNNQIRTRQALSKAIEISRSEGFSDFEAGLIIKKYLKDKLPKTTYYRTLHKLKLIEEKQKVPMEQIYYNNVLEQKDNHKQKGEDTWNYEYEDMILDRVQGFDSTEKYILDIARLFRKLGYTEDKIFTETKRMCKSGGMAGAELEYVDKVLHWKLDTYRKLDNFPGKQPAKSIVQYVKIAATLDMYGIPRDKISAKIKEIVIPIQGMEECYFIVYVLQPTPFADPTIIEMDFLGVWIKSILPRRSGGYVDDDQYRAEREEEEIGIGDGRKYKADEKYCRHCIMK